MQAGCIDAEEGLQSRGKDQDKNLIFPIWLTRLLLFDLLLAPYQLGFWPQGGYASTGEREEEVEWLEIYRGSGRLEFYWIENDIELAYHFCGAASTINVANDWQQYFLLWACFQMITYQLCLLFSALKTCCPPSSLDGGPGCLCLRCMGCSQDTS